MRNQGGPGTQLRYFENTSLWSPSSANLQCSTTQSDKNPSQRVPALCVPRLPIRYGMATTCQPTSAFKVPTIQSQALPLAISSKVRLPGMLHFFFIIAVSFEFAIAMEFEHAEMQMRTICSHSCFVRQSVSIWLQHLLRFFCNSKTLCPVDGTVFLSVYASYCSKRIWRY